MSTPNGSDGTAVTRQVSGVVSRGVPPAREGVIPVPHHEPDREIIECRDCGARFDLAQQNYYENRCPKCVAEDEPKRTWNSCWKCGEKVDPEKETSVKVRGAARDPTWVYMPAHSDCAADHTPRGQYRP